LAEKDLRINEGIRVREVRLIDADGNQKGIVPTFEALQMAREAGVDLVEIAPQAQPPVCKILDYGKYKFELEKKTREARKHQKQIRIKEIRMQPKIDEHDLDFKTRHVKEFLDEGNKVKVSVTIDSEEFEPAIDRAWKAIAKEVKVPGFRAGKVPRPYVTTSPSLSAPSEPELRCVCVQTGARRWSRGLRASRL